MDFELTADQEALRDGIHKLLRGRAPMDRVRVAEQLPGAVDPSLWAELDAAGVFSLRLPEDAGGTGLGMADAVLVFEELGRSLVSGPLVATLVCAGSVDGIVVAVERTGGPLVIEHLGAADHLILLDEHGAWRVAVADVDAEPVPEPIDPLTPLHRLRSVPQGEQVAGEVIAARWRLEGAVLTAALLLGIAAATTEIAVAYAGDRHQFDRPIGSFQAIKHLLADMLVRAEVARAAVYAAGVTLDDPCAGDPIRAAAVAKVQAGQAAMANGKGCIQVHGGMGFTWDADAHLYLKRAWVLDTQFGSASDHAEILADFA